MLILNESEYIAAILSGDFTNNGVLVPYRCNKLYIPLIYHCWNMNGNERKPYVLAIDNCGINNFTGNGFKFLFHQWKNSWRSTSALWEDPPLLRGQTITLDTVELDCLFSIENKRVRAKNLIALFLIKYLGMKQTKVKFLYQLLCQMCGFKIGDHWDKQLRADMGLSSEQNVWRYDRSAMEQCHAGLDSKCATHELKMRYEGDYIYHSGIPFEHNGEGLIQAFESLRRRTKNGH